MVRRPLFVDKSMGIIPYCDTAMQTFLREIDMDKITPALPAMQRQTQRRENMQEEA